MMKKLIAAMCVLSLSVGMLQAQKINEAALLAKVEKATATANDPKKGAKPAAWIALGDAAYEAGTAIAGSLYAGMDMATAGLFFDMAEAPTTTETIGGVEFTKVELAYVNLLFNGPVVAYWEVTNDAFDGMLDIAAEAYAKAYTMAPDSKTNVEKATLGMTQVIDAYRQQAGNLYAAQNMALAAADFAKAYEASLVKPSAKIDTLSAYNAGLLATFNQDFVQGEIYMNKALEMGFEQSGDTYYYLFHSLYGQKKLDEAKAALLEAVAKYSTNTKILESLMGLYAETGDDPAAIIPAVDAAIAKDPTNPELYAGLGRVYDKMGDVEKSLEAFTKAVELAPQDFGMNFNMGLMILKKADAEAVALREKPITSQSEFNADLAKVNATYSEALPYLETAYTVNPTDAATIELLKNVYFRLRDESTSMMDNYNKYNELFKSLQ